MNIELENILEENWKIILENRENNPIKKATKDELDYVYNKLKKEHP